MAWPAHSPDMNIIEIVLGHIMSELRADPPHTIPQLRQRVQQPWDELSLRYLLSLYGTLSRRLAALQRAYGLPTKY